MEPESVVMKISRHHTMREKLGRWISFGSQEMQKKGTTKLCTRAISYEELETGRDRMAMVYSPSVLLAYIRCKLSLPPTPEDDARAHDPHEPCPSWPRIRPDRCLHRCLHRWGNRWSLCSSLLLKDLYCFLHLYMRSRSPMN